jgi:hypothetical protein
MLRHKLPVLAGFLGLTMAIAGACGDGEGGAPATPDGGRESGTIGESVCPEAAPDAGQVCLLPEGTTCAFGACGVPIARCTGGAWRYAGNPGDAQPLCPAEFPVEQSACPPCWPAGNVCTYGSTDCAVSANKTVASCAEGRWTLDSFPCSIPADAGADVQRDADADAD